MPYRDDRQALAQTIDQLEHEAEGLRDQLAESERRYQRLLDEHHANQSDAGTRRGCLMCGGTLLPVAVFAGHNARSPLPLNMSTLRFERTDGGFSRSAPVHAKACASCGFIHCFIAMGQGADLGTDPAEPAAARDEG